jgi:cytochrome c551/c552
MRRTALVVASFASLLVLAGCGSKGVVEPLPVTVIGSLPTQTSTTAAPANGKEIFASSGCGACHTYAPAGSTAKIGPDLDKLAQYAKQAKQPLAAFVQSSIVDPNAYIQPGFPAGVMPQTYKTQLSAAQLSALVKFLTSPG